MFALLFIVAFFAQVIVGDPDHFTSLRHLRNSKHHGVENGHQRHEYVDHTHPSVKKHGSHSSYYLTGPQQYPEPFPEPYEPFPEPYESFPEPYEPYPDPFYHPPANKFPYPKQAKIYNYKGNLPANRLFGARRG
uniref:MAG-P19 n=1 Tax=Periplaneta americana TaxID=6978 RepID=A0A6G8MVB5_PERAM|nr:MAG-P19 [Periplaneta americana]